MDLRSGKITTYKYNDILSHGSTIIARIPTPIKNPYVVGTLQNRMSVYSETSLPKTSVDSVIVSFEQVWSSWRLIIGDVEYKPIHANYAAWKTYYANR